MYDEDEIEDPNCLESNPLKLTFEDITSAAYKIKDGVIKTACTVSITFCFDAVVILLFEIYKIVIFIYLFIYIEIAFIQRSQHGTLFEKRLCTIHRKVT